MHSYIFSSTFKHTCLPSSLPVGSTAFCLIENRREFMWVAIAVLQNRPMSISKSSPHRGWPDVVSVYTLLCLWWISFLVLTKDTVVVAQNPARIICTLPQLLVSSLGPTAHGINRALISPVLLSSGSRISLLLWQGDSLKWLSLLMSHGLLLLSCLEPIRPLSPPSSSLKQLATSELISPCTAF